MIRWGEKVHLMLECLRTRSSNRGHNEKMMKDLKGTTDEPNPDYLGGRSPYFWICGNNP